MTGLLASALISVPAQAGEVWTTDGKVHEGQVRLEAPDLLVVTPEKPGGAGKSTGSSDAIKVPVSKVLLAALATPKLPENTEKAELPSPLRVRDIGQIGKQATTSFFQGTFSIKGVGAGVSGKTDSFHYVCQTFHGDGDLTLRVIDLQGDSNARVGLMIRAGSDAGTRQASVMVAADGSVDARYRYADGLEIVSTPARSRHKLPVWIKLARQEKQFTSFVSKDGKTWEIVAAAMPEKGAVKKDAQDGPKREERKDGAKEEKRQEKLKPGDPAAGIEMKHTTYAGIALAGTNAGATAVADHLYLREAIGGGGFSSDNSGGLRLVSTPIELTGKGVLLRNGTYVARAELRDFDSRRGTVERNWGKMNVMVSDLARVTFESLSPAQLPRLAADRAGVLLNGGDFMDGEISRIDRGEIKVSSVVFGLTTFRVGDNPSEVQAVSLRLPEPVDTPLRVQMRDGSMLLTDTARVEGDRLVIEERKLGTLKLPRDEVLALRAGAGVAASLASLRPAKVEGPGGFDPAATSVFDPLNASWMSLPGGACASGIVSPGGASISYDLSGRFKAFTFRIGVPERVPARAAVKFIVLADGKKLHESKPMTSKDPAVSISVPVAGAKALTLRVENATSVDIATYGVWGEGVLAK